MQDFFRRTPSTLRNTRKRYALCTVCTLSDSAESRDYLYRPDQTRRHVRCSLLRHFSCSIKVAEDVVHNCMLLSPSDESNGSTLSWLCWRISLRNQLRRAHIVCSTKQLDGSPPHCWHVSYQVQMRLFMPMLLSMTQTQGDHFQIFCQQPTWTWSVTSRRRRNSWITWDNHTKLYDFNLVCNTQRVLHCSHAAMTPKWAMCDSLFPTSDDTSSRCKTDSSTFMSSPRSLVPSPCGLIKVTLHTQGHSITTQEYVWTKYTGINTYICARIHVAFLPHAKKSYAHQTCGRARLYRAQG